MSGNRQLLPHTNISLFLLLLLLLNLNVSFSESDAQILLKFKSSLKNTASLAGWGGPTPPCSGWKGVLCDKGRVWGLKLENMGLHGAIDVETLAKLPHLRSVSFMDNDFEGSLPNLARQGALKTVYLSNNKFSGEIPEGAFHGMLSLKKLHLDNNKLSGEIPAMLARLPKLMELTLQDNEFEGAIPNFQQKGLKTFNISNNRLRGQIPQSLSHFDASLFSGNEELCGAPLEACPATSGGNRKFPQTTIVVVAILLGAALLGLLAVCIFILYRKKKSYHQPEAGRAAAATATATGDLNSMEQGVAAVAAPAGGDQGGKHHAVRLTFLKKDADKFEMQELLKASAEVIGSSVFGSTYKAGLNGKQMVVKRFKHMNQVGKEDFNEHMRRLGRMTHHNVQPIVAFYYKKEEKLLVADFAHNLSLAARLHGSDHRPLDWTTRLRIVKGVAKGLLYLHNELPSLTPAHGHLKSSNVLLDAAFKPLLTDYGLIPILNKEQAEQNLVAYKSPEYKATGKLSKKTDVWSFGILILEILTRKQQSEADLPAWVESAGSTAVFDQEMAGTIHCQEEMTKLLNIGLSCCGDDVDSRPEMKEVAEKVEEIKEKEFDEDFYSSYASESDMRSSRALSEDFKSINI